MWRCVIFLLFPIVLYACETTKVEKSRIGEVHTESFSAAGKTIPLPQGKWVVTGSDIRDNNLGDAGLRTVLVNFNNDAVKGMVLLRTNLVPGFHFGANGYVKAKKCNRTDILFLKTFENERSGKQDCWGINHTGFTFDVKQTKEEWEETRQYILREQAEYPENFVCVYYRFATDNDYVDVYYYRNPELDGMTPSKNRNWSQNDWNKNYINSHPNKLKYVENLKAWGRAWYPRVKESLHF